MNRTILLAAVTLGLLAAGGWLFFGRHALNEQAEQRHYERAETQIVVSNISHSSTKLFRAGKRIGDASSVDWDTTDDWLTSGNYFLELQSSNTRYFMPVPIIGYRSGPDKDGSFVITIRQVPREFPPRSKPEDPDFVFIPSGTFLLGDRLNPQEPHYIWLTGYFIAPFEVTNSEFRTFMEDSEGYADNGNWCEAGKKWKSTNRSHVTALLKTTDTDYHRFGQADQPVVWVNWFEANAYCRWLTKKIGNNRWLFSLPTDAEWEKAARGPDTFDYALGMTISDDEVSLYNWRKNPNAVVTVVGIQATRNSYPPNRYGIYHLTGNVAEWSQSVNVPYNRDHPYLEDERNHDDMPGLRSARGGSWYSAAISYLYIPYRDAFQPEHSNQEMGFRIVAKALP